MLSQRSAPSSPCLLWKSLKVHFCFKRLQEECSGLGALFPEPTGEAGGAGGSQLVPAPWCQGSLWPWCSTATL